ncbi:conserved membrane protein of unknown function [Candidatus Filomicrobium marinum]|uniref:Cytochrome c oxidase assembly protein n=1 Tax=Candidatus Filomicrobium marinum TaxID=1608628 RepID=A0A0D6JBF1_9HYPH|nr:conserved membrane protein of unknown function [Candidatus Filomicrobium marinum]CPR16120.1 conserved membrane protein of unknown function [Candidatus Filomicrobium marinum]
MRSGNITNSIPRPASTNESGPIMATTLLFVAAAVTAFSMLHFSAPHAGPISHHMLLHILVMNAVAPLIAWRLRVPRIRTPHSGKVLVAATSVQIIAIWVAHIPIVLTATLDSAELHTVSLTVLFAAAIWFWHTVLSARGSRRWQPIVALLITGKLFCLLGILLIFAPRPLYNCPGATICGLASTLQDQQLAGLLMTAACPLTYVAAGVIISAVWLHELSASPQLTSHCNSESASSRSP